MKYSKVSRALGDIVAVLKVFQCGLPEFETLLETTEGQMLEYFEEQYRFYDSLQQRIQGKFLIRNYSNDYGWCQEKRWKSRFPGVKLDDGKAPIKRLIKKSRIYISTYNATTYLESLALNVPTIMFWNPKHWELRDDAVPYFKRLKDVGIFHETPESAAAKVVEVWDDVAGWCGTARRYRMRVIVFVIVLPEQLNIPSSY